MNKSSKNGLKALNVVKVLNRAADVEDLIRK
ncbi:Protein of unknown function [Lactobacillus acidophilus DSM 20079 = JCM 1132 = NBRC 13951 = CIP 76.13]|nr:Protein of unknown function [Lactobacillus acidophilus DSM 20079 = JCM 1132 = NBRC 13951 = CIP 76.13]CDF69575.1 Protein of unknown function [Lactobacillus acidophilus CIRM-BIA 442]CDF71370.1 Protein of unknown function [Lactobacillus acidophilus CIRM-BIA 445]CDF75190.1 Protein of unknown function [Lactobacillus acidophilus DSM 20242]